MNWKIIGIVFMILFILETAYIVWAFWYVGREEQRTNECFYEICEDYPDAWYEDNLCTCYEYDMFGEYVVAKTKYMGG